MNNCKLLNKDRFQTFMVAVPSMLDEKPTQEKVLEERNKKIRELQAILKQCHELLGIEQMQEQGQELLLSFVTSKIDLHPNAKVIVPG